MRYLSVCTGVGGFELGFPADWECVGFSEIDKYCCSVLKYHYPSVVNYGDITKINCRELPKFDLLCGGTPCQDLSVAGRKEGLKGRRSGLFFDYIKILRECRPSYLLWENVKGSLSSNGGRDFATIINSFSELGYNICWQVLNAKYFGVPQNRERVFIVGYLGGAGIRQVFFKPKNTRQYARIESKEQTSSSGTQSQISGAITSRYGQRWADETYIKSVQKSQSQANRIYSAEGISPTVLTATGGRSVPMLNLHTKRSGEFGNGEHNDGISFTLDSSSGRDLAIQTKTNIRRLTPLECERLMGWSDNWTQYGIDTDGNTVEISDNQRYRMCGNGVVSSVVRAIVEEMLGN
jgi:DNA (cytosine-5)-methyltransferase 1